MASSNHRLFLNDLIEVVGPHRVLKESAAAGYETDWTNSFRGKALAVALPETAEEVSRILKLCSRAGVSVVPQGGNTGLVGGGVPLRGELILSSKLMTKLEIVDSSTAVAGAGVTLAQLNNVSSHYQFGLKLASEDSATVGGAIATNAGGLRALRNGPMRAQLKGIEAVLSNGDIVRDMSGLAKNNTGYHYTSLLAGSEGTLAFITEARIALVPRLGDSIVILIGLNTWEELHTTALKAVELIPSTLSAEFFTQAGLDLLATHASFPSPMKPASPFYLLLEVESVVKDEVLNDLLEDHPSAFGDTARKKEKLWACRERQPEAIIPLGSPLKLDVSVPNEHWVELAKRLPKVLATVDPQATLNLFGHIAEGNIHVNIATVAPRDGRHENAVLSLVAELKGSIAAEHGVGRLKAPWIHLTRTAEEIRMFQQIKRSFDPTNTLNPDVLRFS